MSSVRLIYTEARAALAQATRMGRLASEDLAQRHELRGYDAIHLVAAERVTSDTSILVTGDRDLCTAAAQLGMAVASTISDNE